MNTILNLIEQNGKLLVPGIYDALSARIAERAGFDACFMSGYAVSGTLLGEPDIGLLTQSEMINQARHIDLAIDVPLIVDADTGYGNELNVKRTINELIAAGIKGCFLEDQVWPKRCGHMEGKQVIDKETFVSKIRTAVETRGERDFFICARTDAIAVHGLDDAIERALAAKAAGADACFVEAPTSLEDMKRIADEVPGLLVANMVEGGKTPHLPADELAALGFRFIVSPVSALFAVTHALTEILTTLQKEGTTKSATTPMVSFSDFADVMALGEKLASAKAPAKD